MKTIKIKALVRCIHNDSRGVFEYHFTKREIKENGLEFLINRANQMWTPSYELVEVLV